MKMKRTELTLVFHLYSIDPQFMIPATHEYGDDAEFNGNERGNLWNSLGTMIWSRFKKYHREDGDSTFGCHLLRGTYYNEDETVQFVINFLTDSHPWPQKDVELCKERKQKADNGELGQTWWIHHLNLPDGKVIDCDRITEPVRQAVLESFEKGISDFLDSIEKGEA